jgi:hypothetical protein
MATLPPAPGHDPQRSPAVGSIAPYYNRYLLSLPNIPEAWKVATFNEVPSGLIDLYAALDGVLRPWYGTFCFLFNGSLPQSFELGRF